jgi:hypothetical protein
MCDQLSVSRPTQVCAMRNEGESQEVGGNGFEHQEVCAGASVHKGGMKRSGSRELNAYVRLGMNMRAWAQS